MTITVYDQPTADSAIPVLLRAEADRREVVYVPRGPVDLEMLTEGPDDGIGWTYRHWDALTGRCWCDCNDSIHPTGTGLIHRVTVRGDVGPGAAEWVADVARQCEQAGVEFVDENDRVQICPPESISGRPRCPDCGGTGSIICAGPTGEFYDQWQEPCPRECPVPRSKATDAEAEAFRRDLASLIVRLDAPESHRAKLVRKVASVRQLERLWHAKEFWRLAADLHATTIDLPVLAEASIRWMQNHGFGDHPFKAKLAIIIGNTNAARGAGRSEG